MGKITRQELSPGLISELNKSGILSELETKNKNNLVEAINEVNSDLDEHKAERATLDRLGHVKAKTDIDGRLIFPDNVSDVFTILNYTNANLTELVDNDELMNSTASSNLTMEWLFTSETIINAIKESSVALGKIIAGIVNINPELYAKLDDVLVDEIAIGAISTNEKAVKLLAESELAMNVIPNSQVAMTALVGSDIAMQYMVCDNEFLTQSLTSAYTSLLWGYDRSRYIWLSNGQTYPYGTTIVTSIENDGYSGGTSVKMRATTSYGANFYGFRLSIDVSDFSKISFYDKGSVTTRRVWIDRREVLAGSPSSTWTKRTLDISDYTGVVDIEFGFYNPSNGNYVQYSDIVLEV